MNNASSRPSRRRLLPGFYMLGACLLFASWRMYKTEQTNSLILDCFRGNQDFSIKMFSNNNTDGLDGAAPSTQLLLRHSEELILPSIAFMFLVGNDGILHEKLWEKWFPDPSDPRYTLHVHINPPKGLYPLLGPFFCPHRVPSAPIVQWGVLHAAMMQLLTVSFVNVPSAKHFIFISASSVPLVSFDEFYRRIVVDDQSKSRICWSEQNQAEPGWRGKNLEVGLEPVDLRKASLWNGYSRAHIKKIVEARAQLDWWDQAVQGDVSYGAPDELILPTFLHLKFRDNATEFSNCTPEEIRRIGYRSCCTHADYWGGTYGTPGANISVPIELLSNNYKGMPANFGSLTEVGLRGLQKEGFLLLRKVNRDATVMSARLETIQITDAILQLIEEYEAAGIRELVPGLRDVQNDDSSTSTEGFECQHERD